jgi:hypothetical protein
MPADPLVDRIMDSARQRLPGAVDNNIYFELHGVLEEFFRMSQCWRERIHVEIIADTVEYEVFSNEMLSNIISLISFENGDGSPFAATLPRPNLLYTPKQYELGDYYMWAVLNVTSPTNDEKYPRFPQWVTDRYAEALSDGVCGRLMAMPAKPYSSPTHAAYYARRFKQAAMNAKIEANRQNLTGGQAWRFPTFAAQGMR